MPNRWLMKSEPDAYGWDDLVAEGEGVWDGVRNAQAAANLSAMAVGDPCFFYHSRKGLEIVGIMEVTRAAFPDPTVDDERWVAVGVAPVRKLASPVSLKAMKREPALADLAIIRQSRLSVAPVTDAEWTRIVEMAA